MRTKSKIITQDAVRQIRTSQNTKSESANNRTRVPNDPNSIWNTDTKKHEAIKSESIVNLHDEEFKIKDHEDEIGPVDDGED
jgi:hypothetical protein